MVTQRNKPTYLKAELLERIRALTSREALFPSETKLIDELVQQLESNNPIIYPLRLNNFPYLLGKWYLVYASRGTVVTRRINNIWGSITTEQIWQNLETDSNNEIVVENGAFIKLGGLGTYELKAEGIWQREANERVAKVSFNSFSFQLINVLGKSNWSLPKLKIPVVEFLRNEALWTTSYLDEEVRIARGATGNLFVFCRHCNATC